MCYIYSGVLFIVHDIIMMSPTFLRRCESFNMCTRREWPGGLGRASAARPPPGMSYDWLKSSNEISCWERSFFRISRAKRATCHCTLGKEWVESWGEGVGGELGGRNWGLRGEQIPSLLGFGRIWNRISAEQNRAQTRGRVRTQAPCIRPPGSGGEARL